ncbi:class I adenylate-forming enzyme family protein [Mycobacterium branderi]|uniref:2-succinylbenzoate--CoA ligase n=1 Tax=Mycobacterium branderi TaxID=43348 RepID=A0A7I7WBW3_9MYCO|nr:fatty acid--CoA ligase family protein [Mycobacterium branderi]MCV7235204.1 long-chain fatty acid--CoA ligase [Mycobacterium branderi]ORA31851.1 AMP-dependent synthetase [Mycobacterium branderi]BBZ14974.1 2-succinylbenzoate--CoA ligase [Mycobacterium branderi]
MGVASVSGKTGVDDLLTRLSVAAPASTALIVDGAEYSFGRLAQASEQVAAQLVPGTRVLARLANNAASVVAIHAAWRAGCSIVAASTMVPEPEVRRRLIATAAAARLTPLAGEGLKVDVVDTGVREFAPAGEAVVMFTSGTTGTPKGASLAFSALRGSVAGIARGNGLSEDGRAPREPARGPRIVLVPIAHMGGFLGVLTAWWLGKPALLVEKFSAERVFDLAQRYRLGVLGLTPAMVWELAQADGEAQLPGVDSVTVGTAAIPEATRIAFEAKYHVPVLRNYGQTEFAGAIAFERPAGTVGRIAPGVQVAILGPDGTPVPTGEVGEIAARAASAMSGYLDTGGRPADPGKWLRTGDLGRLDDSGFLFVVGRVRDMVVCGGFNVYPAQVEAALNDLPGVADSAVAGVPDERLGEVPVAAVVLQRDATADADAIRRALRDRLAAYELPRRVVFVDAIPRHDSGKVNRDEIARLVGSPQP